MNESCLMLTSDLAVNDMSCHVMSCYVASLTGQGWKGNQGGWIDEMECK